MDSERQIRFLYPPLFLVASIAWGLWLDRSRSIGDIIPLELFKEPGTSILAVVAGGGIVVAALGLLINTIPWMVLRTVALVRGGHSHEVGLSPDGLDRIQKVLGYHCTRQPSDGLFLAATFDHDTLPKPIHAWLVRRWNAFNVNLSVVSALVIALVLGARFGIRLSPEWVLTSLVIGAIFGTMAKWARQDTMGMLEFQAKLRSDISKAPDRTDA